MWVGVVDEMIGDVELIVWVGDEDGYFDEIDVLVVVDWFEGNGFVGCVVWLNVV